MKTTCIAVDSDLNALNTVSNFIHLTPGFNSLLTFTDPHEAIRTILQEDVIDLLFLDIEMLDTAGTELSYLIRDRVNKIIITSHNQKHAFDAFEIEADAFLLKPFSVSKFHTIMNRLFLKKPVQQIQKEKDDFFFIKNKNEKFNLIKIKQDEIVAIESLQNYIAIQTTNRKVIAHITLTKIKELLRNSDQFVQVHRSFVISKKYIEEIESNVIKMQGNIKVTLGENYRDELLTYVKTKTIKTGRMQVK